MDKETLNKIDRTWYRFAKTAITILMIFMVLCLIWIVYRLFFGTITFF